LTGMQAKTKTKSQYEREFLVDVPAHGGDHLSTPLLLQNT